VFIIHYDIKEITSYTTPFPGRAYGGDRSSLTRTWYMTEPTTRLSPENTQNSENS